MRRTFACMSAGTANDLDVLVIGAGLSGIAAAYYLRTREPWARISILEARAKPGGTWNLFRYPGVRSDSDMHTLGFSFRPWHGDIALAGGRSIQAYIEETAHEFGIDDCIRFDHRAIAASWSSADARWTVEIARGDGARTSATCRFLYLCTGYYDYERGYLPEFAGMDRYRGEIAHPQFWPDGLDYRNKRVAVIGSGATAVTLVPAMSADAQHVTMVQRSPSYVLAVPGRDPIAVALNRALGNRLAHPLVRWKNVLRQMFFYNLMRRYPAFARKKILEFTQKALGPQFDTQRHFTPVYEPWDQRMCFVPDGDLFAALRSGRASIATGEIECFTETGLRLRGGEEIDADIIVTATGLNVKLMGGMQLDLDGKPLDLANAVSYKGMMFCGVPNLALALGYTNASWTLKCELTARYVCRVVRRLRSGGYAYCVPQAPPPGVGTEPAIGLKSGYIVRAHGTLPRQGRRAPWKLHQNYALDLAALRFGKVEDGVMQWVKA